MKDPKSKRYIINVFLQIRAHKELERITVTEICEMADIHKSTFYKYFRDVYDLSAFLQQEVIDRIAQTLPDLENITKNRQQFTKDILMAYEANKQQISTLFSGSQSYRLPILVKEKILRVLDDLEIQTIDRRELVMKVDFYIYGTYYAFIEENDMNEMEKIDFISKLAGEI